MSPPVSIWNSQPVCIMVGILLLLLSPVDRVLDSDVVYSVEAYGLQLIVRLFTPASAVIPGLCLLHLTSRDRHTN